MSLSCKACKHNFWVLDPTNKSHLVFLGTAIFAKIVMCRISPMKNISETATFLKSKTGESLVVVFCLGHWSTLL